MVGVVISTTPLVEDEFFDTVLDDSATEPCLDGVEKVLEGGGSKGDGATVLLTVSVVEEAVAIVTEYVDAGTGDARFGTHSAYKDPGYRILHVFAIVGKFGLKSKQLSSGKEEEPRTL